MHLHVRLMNQFPTVVIPGVTAMSGCWSAAGLPIARGDDVLTVVPGTLDERELLRRFQQHDPTVVMKIGRNLAKVRRWLAAAERLAHATYVERVKPGKPADDATRRQTRRRGALLRHRSGGRSFVGDMSGKLTVVGLGPGSAQRLRPRRLWLCRPQISCSGTNRISIAYGATGTAAAGIR